MASGPITSWQIDVETVEKVADFIFLGSKITIHSDFGAQKNKVADFIFLGSKITVDGDAAMKLKDAYSLKGKL